MLEFCCTKLEELWNLNKIGRIDKNKYILILTEFCIELNFCNFCGKKIKEEGSEKK